MAHQYDVIIIGSGTAGLSLALRLAAYARVAVISKTELASGASYWAQGGIAAVLDTQDSFTEHCQDTLIAGADLCDPNAVEPIVKLAPEMIQWLDTLGVNFCKNDTQTQYDLTREGGHGKRRIVHAHDATGKAIQTTLIEHVLAHPQITIFPHTIAIDLIVANKHQPEHHFVQGVYLQNCQTEQITALLAPCTVLATGGASRVYLYNTNPDVASGDGIAMAWRAGCSVANMEFNQFHPTCLYHPQAKTLLLTEAIRGEGGFLLTPDGQRFMQKFHPQAELAPRDIVARAIDHEMKRLGVPCLYLDISHKSKQFIQERFPTLYEQCLQYGIDMTKERLPIVPAAHYTCGGIQTDIYGQTDIPRLFAIGETAYTGLHGANRMASNSLLECLSSAYLAHGKIQTVIQSPMPNQPVAHWDESQTCDPDERVVITHNWEELRRFMWDYVGIVRTTKRLQRAYHRVQLLKKEISEYYWRYRVTPDLLELRNLVDVAQLIIISALLRKESRGLHYNTDYPHSSAAFLKPTVLNPLVIRTLTEFV